MMWRAGHRGIYVERGGRPLAGKLAGLWAREGLGLTLPCSQLFGSKRPV